MISSYLRDHPTPGRAFPADLAKLEQEVRDCDTHGLGQWFFLKDGQRQEPFKALCERHPEVWKHLQRAMA